MIPESVLITDRRAYELVNNHIDYVQVFVPYLKGQIVLCSRENAEKYGLKIIVDPRNPDNNGLMANG